MRVYPVDLKLIVDRFANFLVSKEIVDFDYADVIEKARMKVFTQMWGSTALGFIGVGGQAMTEAYTTVCYLCDEKVYGVFFGEKLAYVIKNPNTAFLNDCSRMEMASQFEVNRYQQDGVEMFIV